jgi:hypothetical protein
MVITQTNLVPYFFNTCEEYNVNLYDMFQNPTTAAATRTIDLSFSQNNNNGLTGEFYSDSQCQNQVTSIQIPQGSPSGHFYLKTSVIPPTGGVNGTVSASEANGALTPTGLPVYLNELPAKIEFNPADGGYSGTCDNGYSANIVLLDAYGNQAYADKAYSFSITTNGTTQNFVFPAGAYSYQAAANPYSNENSYTLTLSTTSSLTLGSQTTMTASQSACGD